FRPCGLDLLVEALEVVVAACAQAHHGGQRGSRQPESANHWCPPVIGVHATPRRLVGAHGPGFKRDASPADTARMNLLHDVLRAARGSAPASTRGPRSALVVGAAGVLGAAVLEQLLATQAFARVSVL